MSKFFENSWRMVRPLHQSSTLVLLLQYCNNFSLLLFRNFAKSLQYSCQFLKLQSYCKNHASILQSYSKNTNNKSHTNTICNIYQRILKGFSIILKSFSKNPQNILKTVNFTFLIKSNTYITFPLGSNGHFRYHFVTLFKPFFGHS